MFIDWSLFRFINWPFTKPHPEYTAGQWQRSTGLAHEQGDFHNCDFFYGVFILLDLAAVTKGVGGAWLSDESITVNENTYSSY